MMELSWLGYLGCFILSCSLSIAMLLFAYTVWRDN